MGTSLPRRRAFLVQYTSDADLCGDHLCGRVEHVESGRSRRFASRQELDEFVIRVLSEGRSPDEAATESVRNHERRRKEAEE